MFSCRHIAKKVQKATRNKIQLTILSERVASVQNGILTSRAQSCPIEIYTWSCVSLRDAQLQVSEDVYNLWNLSPNIDKCFTI